MTERFYSADDERFDHRSLVDLLDDLAGECDVHPGLKVYTALFRELTPADLDRAEYLLEQWDEDLYDIVGEDCNLLPFSTVSDSAKAELREVIASWMMQHVSLKPFWTIVGESTVIELTAADIEHARAETPNAAHDRAP